MRGAARSAIAGMFAACAAFLPALAMAADAADSPGKLQAPMLLEQTPAPAVAPAPKARLANFAQAAASVQARKLADWVMHSADNKNLPFMIVDKVQAQVFVFDAQGQLRGASAALLGLAPGDDSAPDIGKRKLSDIRPHERTTPAGRFVASLDRDINGKPLLWIDYDGALSLHPVVTAIARERRAETRCR